ncbi:MAG: ABC-2 family transporter protein [Anaerolineales bacterium]|nr:ABC-2 family transporter protein [Anaerolineales bacterium]
MRTFIELSKRSFQRFLTYRAATLAGLLTNLFFGILRAAIYLGLYGVQNEVKEVSIEGIITYTGISQAVIAYLSMFGWYDLMDSIYSGEVSSDLLKPIGLFRLWLARDLGRAAVAFLLRGLLLMVIYSLVFDLTYPSGILQWLSLAAAIVLSWLVSFSFRFLINLSAFWSPDSRGIIRLFFVASWFLSGFLMPLRFLPEWVERLAYFTPFPQMVNTVVEVYLGVLEGHELAAALLLQAAWALVLIGASHLVMSRGLRRLVILGG